MNKVPEFLIFPSWLFCWYFTPLGTGRHHMGLLDKHPTLSRSAKRHCYCYCLMPCTSIVVVPQSTHTYVIKLRGSGTIQAIVTPNSDQHNGPHQSRSKLTLALHNCFPGLEMTVFCWGFLFRVQTNLIGPCWELPSICHSIGLQPSVESVGIFCEWRGLMDGDESSMKGKDKRRWDILEWLQRYFSFCGLQYLFVCEFVCVHLRANVDDCVRGDW